MRSVLILVLNLIWLVTAGIWLFVGYVLAGILACVFIITIPFGVASFRIAAYVLWPFGREVVDRGRPGGVSAAANVIWFVVAGIWLALGHVATALAQAVTVIGLPLAWANLKLIPVTCFPFGKEIIRSDRAAMLPVASR
ncbi:YccF domain-containing protein [Rhodococcus sp. IEGM 1408]|uniref:YccF domain-containing protein n=1 Tax=Rhodococcus sp. IEGM 1408 TaxID=3082220 RepID=UPI002954D992|nr:YccF domain-containing protein [Rhodococcus sp. IEGM 1408]MDV8001276.1 YccF domain-containing protein [Rhodococcus sp. IEGM 1408]